MTTQYGGNMTTHMGDRGAFLAAALYGSDGLFGDCETAVYLGGDKARSAHGMVSVDGR
jgi:hypothetical protein